MKKIKKRSPLKARPLRYPGQSLDERIQDIFYDDVFTNLSMSLVLVFFAMYQWYEKIYNKPPLPEIWTFFAIVFLGYAVIKFVYVKKEIKNMKLGRDGERVVGQFLESLRADGYDVFHDLRGKGFNLDHIIVGPAGVFSIETKTWSKLEKGQSIIDYDGNRILMNGIIPDKNPIIQAKLQRDWLKKIILKITGKSVLVRAIVVYPGWFINCRKKDPEVWVLEPKALPKYLKNEKSILNTKEVSELSFQISRYIRAEENLTIKK